ncbi:hypothetical protein [Shewanella frigidimarina]|uniref:hypothetical protein n=1 Tax=Shewanella frigidimarina TaxID=56812 RepID=UPI003D7B8FAA
MGLPVTVYRWDDAGAPQIDGTPLSFLTLLKACLVNGYGNKNSLGWSIAFENLAEYKIAFRNSTVEASGGFVQFESNNGLNDIYSPINMAGARSMTGLNAYYDPQALQIFAVNEVMTRWVIIGTSAGFWFMANNNALSPSISTIDSPQLFCGDLDTIIANDVGRFVCLNYPTVNDMTSSSWSYAFNYSQSPGGQCCRIYDTDGSSNWITYNMDMRYLQGTHDKSGVPQGNRDFIELYLYSSLPPYNVDRLGVDSGMSQINPYYRGKITGLLNSPSTGYNDQQWPVIENINGSDYMLMCGYLFGRTWIKMDIWYE